MKRIGSNLEAHPNSGVHDSLWPPYDQCISAAMKVANLPILQFPCISHHEIKVGVIVNRHTDSSVIVHKLIFRHLVTITATITIITIIVVIIKLHQ